MPVFVYKALDEQGGSVSGELTANSAKELTDELMNQGLLVHSIKAKQSGNKPAFFRSAVSTQKLMLFIQELSTLLRAGLSISGY